MRENERNAYRVQKTLRLCACVLACVFMFACASSEPTEKALASSSEELSGATYEAPQSVNEPIVLAGGDATIDTAHANEGYICASAQSESRLKFQVRHGDETYNYDLPNDGTPLVAPVNMGSGSYMLRIMQNVSGNNYAEMLSSSVDVSLASEFSPFLVGNVFCSFNASSSCVKRAQELTKSAANVAEVVKIICEYVASNVKYDNAKAERLAQASGYVPNPDETLSSKSGICFDFASLSAAMLRSVGIPSKVMTGYVGQEQLYHAWIMVYVNGTWHTVKFSVDPNTWSRCDVTFASTGSTKYVGDGSAYTDRYTY